MARLVFLILFFQLLQLLSASSIRIIELEASFKQNFVMLKTEPYTPLLILNETFTFHLTSDEIAHGIQCRKQYKRNSNLFYSKLKNQPSDRSHDYILVSESQLAVTANMNGTWICNLYRFKDSPNPIQWDFNVIVNELDEIQKEITAFASDDKRIVAHLPPVPFMNSSFYVILNGSKVVHYHHIDYYVELNKGFTIYLTFTNLPSSKTKALDRLVCCNPLQETQIYLNDVLSQVTESQYTAQVPNFSRNMYGDWQCDIRKAEESLIRYNFSVKPDDTDKPKTKDKDATTQDTTEWTLVDPTAPDADDNSTAYIDISLTQNDRKEIEEYVTVSNVEAKKMFDFSIICDICSETIRIKCHYAENTKIIYVNEKKLHRRDNSNGKHNEYTKKVKADTAMDAPWTCAVDLTKHIQHNFNFTVHFLKRGVARFLVNDVLLNNTIVENKAYNEKAVYKYRAGELVKVVCNKKEGPFMNMTLHEYGNDTVFNTLLGGFKMTMYVKLTASHNQAYIDCNVQLKFGAWFTTRLEFFHATIKNLDWVDPELRVNDLILNSKINTNDYVYEYYDGETLVITSSMQDAKCEPHNIELKDFSVTPLNILLTPQEKDNGVFLICNSTTISKSTFNLTLRLIPTYFSPKITGLSSANTLLKYQPHRDEYHIIYDNTKYDYLLLNCISNVTECYWEFDDSQVNVNYVLDMHVGENYVKHRNFTILSNVSSTTIECCCPGHHANKTITEIVNRKPRSYNNGHVELKMTTNPSKIQDDGIQPDTKLDSPGPLQGRGPWEHWMRWAIIAAAGITLILVTWAIVGIYKRKQRLQQASMQAVAVASNINYENLPPHNEGHMPTPPQWDREPVYVDTYSVPYVGKDYGIYAQPVTMDHSVPEGPYAEIRNSEPNIKGTASQYANVKEMPAYSQIMPKSLRNDGRYQQTSKRAKPQVLPNVSGATYAQVVPKSQRPPKSGDSKYANVFENQRYTNVDTQAKCDYTEPAYCELNNKMK